MKKILWTMLIILIIGYCSTGFAKPPVYVDNFNDALALSESTKTDLFVVFGAEWCGHCRIMKSDIAKKESILDDKIICYINIDHNKDLAKEYRVRKIPDYMVLKDKIEVKRKVGYNSIEELEKWLLK